MQDGLLIRVSMSLQMSAIAFDMYSYDANDYNRELLYKNEEGLELADISDDRWLVYVKNNSNADALYIVLEGFKSEIRIKDIEYASLGDNLIYATNEFGEFREYFSLLS